MEAIFDSRKRVTGTWDKATLRFDRGLYASRFKINYISFFNTFFNVTSQTNQFTVDASLLTLQPGIYSVASLAAALDARVKTVNVLYSVAVFDNSLLVWNVGTLQPGGTAEFVLGTRDRGPLVGGFLTLPVLTFPDEVFIRSPHLVRSDVLETDQERNDPFLYTVLVDAPTFAQNIHRPEYYQVYNLLSVRGMREFTFELTDSKGRKLEGYPSEWILHVTFYE